MKRNNIFKTNKESVVSLATIRSILKKDGFTVGHWANNGRITGLANFYCGDLEVKEYEVEHKLVESERLGESHIWKFTYFKKVAPEIKSWNDKIDMKEVAKLLISKGYKVKEEKCWDGLTIRIIA